MVKEEKSKIVTTETIATQLTTKDENPLMASAATASALTASTATAQNVWSGSQALGPLLYLTANITATYYTATNTFKSCDKVTSSLTGFVSGVSYVQTSCPANINSTKKTLTVVVYGTESFYVVVEGMGTFYAFQVNRTYIASL